MAGNEPMAAKEALKVIYVADVDTEIPPSVTNNFDKYKDFRDFNAGGKATLKICKDTNLGREVVLKMLHPKLKGDKQELKRLLREARITAQLAHPSTVPLYELGRDNEGRWFFAMKKLAGQNLFQIIVKLAQRDEKTENEFTLDRLLGIFTQVGDALPMPTPAA